MIKSIIVCPKCKQMLDNETYDTRSAYHNTLDGICKLCGHESHYRDFEFGTIYKNISSLKDVFEYNWVRYKFVQGNTIGPCVQCDLFQVCATFHANCKEYLCDVYEGKPNSDKHFEKITN